MKNKFVTWAADKGWGAPLYCRCGVAVHDTTEPDLWESDDFFKKMEGHRGSIIPMVSCRCERTIFGVAAHGLLLFHETMSLLRVSVVDFDDVDVDMGGDGECLTFSSRSFGSGVGLLCKQLPQGVDT